MVRPLSGANALAPAMAAQFDQIVAEASDRRDRMTTPIRTCSSRSTSATRPCATA